MLRRTLILAATLMLSWPLGAALADYVYRDGNGGLNTIFDFVCFTTKHCPAHVLIDSTGTEKATAGNPLRVDPTGTTTQPVNVGQIGGAGVATGHGTAAGALRVELPTDGTGQVNALQSGTWTDRIVGNSGSIVDATIGPGTAPANMFAVGGIYNSTEISPTTGQSAALQLDSKGRLRNVIMDAAGNTRGANVNASNQLSVSLDGGTGSTVTLGAGAATIGALTANQSVNVNQVAGSAVSTAATGVQKVGVVGNAGATLDAAVGAGTAPTNGLAALGIYNSTEISPTTGQSAALQLDSKGRLRNVIMDAAGNTRGANVNASNQLSVSLDGGNGGTVAATESGTWTVQPGNTANTTPWLMSLNAATSGGTTPCRVLSAASTNSTNCKGSAGQIYGFVITNINASVRFVKLYNKATAPTCGTDTPNVTLQIPGNSSGSGMVAADFSSGVAYGTGIGLCITGAVADNDTTAVGANDVIVNLLYK